MPTRSAGTWTDPSQLIVSAYIGEMQYPRSSDFEVMDSKEAGERFDGALGMSMKVGETLYVIAVALEEGP